MCLRHWYTPSTKHLRIVGVMSQWKSRVVDRQKETAKIRQWTSYVKTAVWQLREAGDKLGIGKSSVQRTLSDLSMTRVCARRVPFLLNEDQMQSRASASKEFFKIQKNHALFLWRNEYDVKRHLANYILTSSALLRQLLHCMYHSFNCDKNLIYNQKTLKFHSDIQKNVRFLWTK